MTTSFTDIPHPEQAFHQTEKIARRIKYESELDPKFGDKIATMAYGEKLFACIQCGTCSATCPLSHYMDYTPRKIIAMVRSGFRDEVLNSATIWLCASCYSCSVECPKGIKITDVMYALKREAMINNIIPKHIPTPVLAKEFFHQILAHGRNNEVQLITRFYLLTKPWKMLKKARIGFKLWRVGRLSFFEKGVKYKKLLHQYLTSVEQREEAH